MSKTEEKPKQHRRTLEEREQATLEKLEKIKSQRKNREVKKVWTSNIRKWKGELNNTKGMTYVEKIQELVNKIYNETKIYADIEEDFEEEEE